MQRCAAALGDDGVQHVAERASADEEGERLVLVWRPGAQEPAEDAGDAPLRRRQSPPRRASTFTRVDARKAVRAALLHERLSGRSEPITLLASFILVPTYEYKCPNGHVFEVFKRIADPAPEACAVCGASPVETVLYPVPVHFRGSGFYSTDYGRGGRKKERSKESADSGSSEKKDKPHREEGRRGLA